MRHLAAGHERVRHAAGELEQLAQPLARDLLDDRGRGRRREQAGVLVPRRGHPVGGERGRQRAAEHEAEPPSAGHAGDAGIRVGHELLEHLARVDRLVLQRTRERCAQRVDVDRREHRTLVERLEVVGRELRGPGEQIARFGHRHQPYKRRLASPNALRARSRRRCRADGRRHRTGRRRLGAARVALRRTTRRDGSRARDDAQEPHEARGERRGCARRRARARERRRRARPCRPDGRGGRRGRGREARRLPPRRRHAAAGGGARVEHVLDPDLLARGGDEATRSSDRHALLQPGARAEARGGRSRARHVGRDDPARSSSSRRSSGRCRPRRTTSPDSFPTAS